MKLERLFQPCIVYSVTVSVIGLPYSPLLFRWPRTKLLMERCGAISNANFSAMGGVVAPLWLSAKSAYGGGRGMFDHEVSQAQPVQAREAEEVPRSQLGGIQRRAAPPGRFDGLV